MTSHSDGNALVIELTEEELGWIGHLAALRNIVAVRTRRNDYKKVNKRTGMETDLEGMIGEYAFCSYMNAYWHPFPQAFTSGGIDCEIAGLRIDVKSTDYPKGKLMVNLKDNPDIDIYVLAVRDEENAYKVIFPGFAPKWQVCREENIERSSQTGEPKNVFCLRQHQLFTKWDDMRGVFNKEYGEQPGI